jgi:hypothetical protein
MKKTDKRTLTNQPDPPDLGKSRPKRIRTQIHRRTPSSESLIEQWDADSPAPPKGLRTSPDKMVRRSPPDQT